MRIHHPIAPASVEALSTTDVAIEWRVSTRRFGGGANPGPEELAIMAELDDIEAQLAQATMARRLFSELV